MKAPEIRPETLAPRLRVAVLVPCLNECLTVAQVVSDFSLALPQAEIYVFDNGSTDGTAERALAAGAHVVRVAERGKGHVVRRMFADVEAEVYVLVDGDGTYDAQVAPALVHKLLLERLDMVVATRFASEASSYRAGHQWGNRLLTGAVEFIFGTSFTDLLSGYRVFSRRYVKSFPAHARGFETETELAVHALGLRLPVGEVLTSYRGRPAGSTSKLRTYADGWRILGTIVGLFQSERPLLFFSLGFFACALLSIGLAVPVFQTYFATGLVPRLPTALLCAALFLFGTILLICGIVLDAVTLARRDMKRLAYLSIAPLPEALLPASAAMVQAQRAAQPSTSR